MKRLKSQSCFALALMFSQIAGSCAALADTPKITVTPELQLFESLVTIRGEHLSPTDAQSQINAAMTEYQTSSNNLGNNLENNLGNNPASDQDRELRVKDALITMNFLTPAQGDELLSSAQEAVTTNSADLTSTIRQIADAQLGGAQFSSCARDYTIEAAVIAASSTLIALQFTSVGRSQSQGPSASENNSFLYVGFAVLVAGSIITLESASQDCN